MEQPEGGAHHHRHLHHRRRRPPARAGAGAARQALQLHLVETGMERYLRIEDLGMTFETKNGSFVALERIDLTVKKGEFVSLIGHSGCGKSTLLNLVAGLLQPTAG